MDSECATKQTGQNGDKDTRKDGRSLLIILISLNNTVKYVAKMI